MSSTDALMRQAVTWHVLLNSGDANDDDHQRFQAWLEKHPSHGDAWKRVHGALDKALSPLRDQAGADPVAARALRNVIERPPRRRFIRGALAVTGIGISGGLLLSRMEPLDALGADFATGTAERRQFDLGNGNTLQLNARSIVNRADGALRLERGEMLVTCTEAATPFQVNCDSARILSHGGRFMVRKEGSRALVVAMEGPLAIEPGQGRSSLALAEGLGVYVEHATVTPYAGDATASAAWQRGLLEVDNQPLAQVVDALRAYRHGYIRLSPRAATLPVLGVLPLDDTDRALDLLGATLPIHVTHYGPLLVVIDTARIGSVG
ncbi:DUF4880 domain-containing protein [Dyella sp. C11]|uniref:DUF4880 domain-containing protein n=1 Tax=Dyella sp. C11 TaxID=2126991 RepID=UPI0018E55F51|nr:DUF4880 domain-containing protein [Dyella sp. C11]